MQPNKTIKILINYFLGPVLFLWLSFSIYQQILHQPRLEQSWQGIKASFSSSKIILLLLTIVFIPLNWGLEALKWKWLVRPIKPLGFFQCFKAVLSGVSFSVIMPNRMGEYVGRMMYMPPGSRLKTISAAIVGSIAQLIATLFFGWLGLIFIKKPLLLQYPNWVISFQFLFYGVLLMLVLVVFFYFNVEHLVSLIRKWLGRSKYLYLVESLSNFNGRFLIRLVIISFLRYGVFLFQYIMVFHLFNLDVGVDVMAFVTAVIFLAMALIPSVALVELGLRGEVSLILMGLFTGNTLAIGLTAVTIWFLNLIVPAIVGSLLLLNVKLLKKNETA